MPEPSQPLNQFHAPCVSGSKLVLAMAPSGILQSKFLRGPRPALYGGVINIPLRAPALTTGESSHLVVKAKSLLVLSMVTPCITDLLINRGMGALAACSLRLSRKAQAGHATACHVRTHMTCGMYVSQNWEPPKLVVYLLASRQKPPSPPQKKKT